MVDVDTFLTTLYVIMEDFCQSYPPRREPGSEASLSDSEAVTMAIFARWGRFSSKHDLYRYAEARLPKAFPTLPDRSQFNRSVCYLADLIEACLLQLVALLNA